MDRVVGGPGLNRGRRHPEDLRVGDYVDSREVVAMEPGRRPTLGFGMRAPGSGVLAFELRPEGARTRVTVTAYRHPAGLWGLVYRYPFAPAHGVLFAGRSRAIAREAEIRTAGAGELG